ncbi:MULTISPECIES: phenol hydroxylase subunit P4 [Comamonadaceae]|jgi:phenol hydroxylase P4 protein|uniref:Phenol hydroxylase subunit P4 n=1 Tax=Ottowia beijingensis TaxID=1207057 RepID=A0A853IZC4_9BURK|nr:MULTISPECIES: phenol hydroxylase subunit P4 [Comamonadaceae]BAH90067.1 phenol hydroxylase conserved region [uncultured bacterium]MBP3979530.1 phenol hydroxylase subunit P4 [Acidovorax sp. JG5]NZA03289.1 phenol hydroxylase subunit P4 [Ottowia beijingensis]NZA03404.1 phenol hydroxylase subunit P4 [Ottowia beijingensis]QYY25835.1 phenol hydroxylase subunit P4 [Diaphorobacter sp. MNS-0]
MSVVAVKPYDFPARDRRENFPAPLLYIGWEDHLMFASPVCLPLPPDTPFGALAQGVLPGVYGEHPDFAKIDWSQVEWFKSGQPWTPDPAKSLQANGLQHKDAIRFRTPGLTGIQGTCS